MNKFRRVFGAFAVVICAAASASADENYTLHSFQRRQLSDTFLSEGATYADINRDGHEDIVSGPHWYAGPDFKNRFEIYPAMPFDIGGYSENFFAFTHDFDGDDWQDVLIIGFPGKEVHWFRNPQSSSKHWDRHLAFSSCDNESPSFTDLTGDGQPELVCCTGGRMGFAEIPVDPTQLWKFRAISPDMGYEQFTHGLGVGDISGDGRADVLEKDGWFEQPPANVATGEWSFHRVPFAEAGGAQMLVFDVDGDGDNDVVTSKAAHAYGLSWFENTSDGTEPRFTEHLIMGGRPDQNDYGVVFSELHALAQADVDDDGVPDIITGKRFWAHGEHDPGAKDPAVSYWFKTIREDGKVRFVPHLIDNDSGVGTQVVVGDVNGDKLPDVVVGNKKGTFVLLHRVETVDKRTWETAQPTRWKLAVVAPVVDNEKLSPGFIATTADGRKLNLDFETGDLTDWTATGEAFASQPIKGDTVAARRGDMASGHVGNYWIGTYEASGDAPKGTLTSRAFPVTHPFASLLVGGGSLEGTRVNIIRADTNDIVFTTSGSDNEHMRQVAVDLRPHQGKEVFIRLVDDESGSWGHINFDHFRFQDAKTDASPVESQAPAPALDDYPFAKLSPEESIRAMKLPSGFSAKVFAAEPDVKQPIAIALDDRGRLWIAEAYEYPQRAPEGQGRDRILIFEDTNGDAHFDKRTVFAEGLNLVSGIEVGFGGVWVGAAPYLMFIPDRNGDDIADGKPEILLDGWGYQDTHETLNTFIWGPDGWLYGCHGVFTHSRVGKPGAADDERIPINAGIWRYHPTRHKFEVFAEGTSNPWGVDFDDHGQAVCTACVIPHLYHMIQGGRYQRQAGEPFNPYTYDDIKTIADHRHYLGASPHSGNDRSDEAGGGHAHAGAMIYLGAAWPNEYRGQIFMNNIHGQRLNMDLLKPQGSGLVGSHGPDFLLTRDRASQMLNFRYGPDGQVYVIDWYDMQACHDPDADIHDRTNGRIYKIDYADGGEKEKSVGVDLTKLSDRELAEKTLDKNDWYVRHSRRILQQRTAVANLDPAARDRLADIATSHPDETRRLRAMWTLHVTGGLSENLVAKLLGDKDEFVRGWTIQLALDRDKSQFESLLPRFVSMAKNDPSPVVRLYLASAAQKVAPRDRWELIAALTDHAEDADDHNLPLMYWYAAEPLAEVDPERALALGLSCGKTMPVVRDFVLRRIASVGTPAAVTALAERLTQSSDSAEQLAILHGLRNAFRGRRQVAPPGNWTVAYTRLSSSQDKSVRVEAAGLGVTFGNLAAIDRMREIVGDKNESATARRAAIESMLGAMDLQLVALLQQLLSEPALRETALKGLAQFDDAKTPVAILAVYADLSPSEKRTAVATLCGRVEYAIQLLQAIAEKKIPINDLSADAIRQLTNLENKDVDQLVGQVWGKVRTTAAEKAELIDSYRKLLTGTPMPQPDPELGRAVYNRTCQQCHTLYGVGNTIGPDITGSNRGNLDYLLSNIVDPSALIAKDYQPTMIITSGGRAVTGIVSAEDAQSVILRSATETLAIPKDEIDERSLSETSMMPDDQLKQFSQLEIRSLFSYLESKSQTPMLATKENAELLFNGHDLTGWTGDTQLWSVDNEEIVGHSEGLEHNTFLVSDLAAEDFRLTVEVKLVNDAGNSGIQFRSQPIDGFQEMKGYQADIGPSWWGKLYEENGRELLWDKSGEEQVRKGGWNAYEIIAERGHIRTSLNGHPCVDFHDETPRRRGIFALQLHSGGPTEVRFRNMKLQVLDAAETDRAAISAPSAK